MKATTLTRLFALAGPLGGLGWIAISLFPPEWGPPGTPDYLYYELWNRLWTPALLLMGLAFLGFFLTLRPALNRWARGGLLALLAGFALMLLGNVAEFWIFTSVPYSSGSGPNVRDLAWMTFLVGTLIMLTGGSVAGLASFKTPAIPTWLAGALALLLPATVGLAVINLGWMGWPTGGLSLLIGAYGFGPALAVRAHLVKGNA